MQSKARTVEQYLKELPADRRAIVAAVRQLILENIDQTFEEGMQYGMIGYYVPHSVYPAGYHCDSSQPLPYLCLASQKNYLSLYLMSLYADGADNAWFQAAWAKSGKKLDMGKSCVRFKTLEDLPLDVIAEAIRRVPAKKHIAQYENAIAGNARRKGESPRSVKGERARPPSRKAAPPKAVPRAGSKPRSSAKKKTPIKSRTKS
jgi:hypothetical protein